jgi:enoyl-CoA hydratase
MSWDVRELEGASVVTMTSNPVNKQNPAFFADLEETFARLDETRPGHPVVLTGSGDVFSAGIDFDYSFELFARRDLAAVLDWFRAFRGAMLRVLTSPRPTVAAVNGHALAGGLILALCCDFRVARDGPYRASLNEVPVGIPMPSVYSELIRHRVGSAVAARAILTGEIYTPARARELGFYDELSDDAGLLSGSVALATRVPPDCVKAYTHSKLVLLAPLLERIETLSSRLDLDTARLIMDEELAGARLRALTALKKAKRG